MLLFLSPSVNYPTAKRATDKIPPYQVSEANTNNRNSVASTISLRPLLREQYHSEERRVGAVASLPLERGKGLGKGVETSPRTGEVGEV